MISSKYLLQRKLCTMMRSAASRGPGVHPKTLTYEHPKTMADNKARAAEFKNKGNAALSAGNFDEAIENYTKVRCASAVAACTVAHRPRGRHRSLPPSNLVVLSLGFRWF